MISGLVLVALLAGSGQHEALSPQNRGQAEAPAHTTSRNTHGQENPIPERLRGWLQWPPDDDSERGKEPERGVFPLVGVVVPGSGLSVGAGYRDFALFGSPLGVEISGLFSVRGYQLYRAHVGLLGRHRRLLDLRRADAPLDSPVDDRRRPAAGFAAYLDARYRHLPRERFYGLGPESREDDRSDYLLKGPALDLAIQEQVTPAFGFAARAGVLGSTLEDGHDDEWPGVSQRFASPHTRDLLRAPRYLVAGVGAAYDTGRHTAGDEPRGLFISAAAWRFDGAGGDEHDFTRLTVETRAYLPPGRVPGLFALRFVASTHVTAPGASVPFFLQGTLGGSKLLRSFGVSRFRDTAVAHGTVEYRWRVHPLIELAPFLDAGTVGPGLGKLGSVKIGAGIGARACYRDLVFGRADAAWGAEGFRLLFDAGPVF